MSEDRDILISRYLDGSATDDEVMLLDRAITSEPAAGDELVRTAYMDALLHDALPTADEADVAPIRLPNSPLPAAHRRLPTVWIAIAASLIVAAGVTWIIVGRNKANPTNPGPVATVPPAPVLVAAGPNVMIERAGQPIPGTTADDGPLLDADRVRTGPGDVATLGYPNERTTIRMSGDTVLLLGRHEAGKQFELAFGSIACDVGPQPRNAPMLVKTGQAAVNVVGTQFQVRAVFGWTRVQVSQGTVRVSRLSDGATVDVSAGQYVDVAGPGNPVAHTLGPGQGRSMGDAWSVDLRPAGIRE